MQNSFWKTLASDLLYGTLLGYSWKWLITKTFLYNVNPLKPNFYTVNLELTGYTLLFLFLLKSIDCGICYNRLAETVLTSTRNLLGKVSDFLSENVRFLVIKFSVYLNRLVFVMCSHSVSHPAIPKSDERDRIYLLCHCLRGRGLVWLILTQLWLITMLPSLIARRWVGPQTKWRLPSQSV